MYLTFALYSCAESLRALCAQAGLRGGPELEPPNRRWMAQLLRWHDKPKQDDEPPHWQTPGEEDEE